MRKERTMLSTFKEMLAGLGGVFEPVSADPTKPRKAPRNVLPTARKAEGYVRSARGFLMRKYRKPTEQERRLHRKQRIAELKARDAAKESL